MSVGRFMDLIDDHQLQKLTAVCVNSCFGINQWEGQMKAIAEPEHIILYMNWSFLLQKTSVIFRETIDDYALHPCSLDCTSAIFSLLWTKLLFCHLKRCPNEWEQDVMLERWQSWLMMVEFLQEISSFFSIKRLVIPVNFSEFIQVDILVP